MRVHGTSIRLRVRESGEGRGGGGGYVAGYKGHCED